jgi:hypothetical protein
MEPTTLKCAERTEKSELTRSGYQSMPSNNTNQATNYTNMNLTAAVENNRGHS